MAKVKLTDRAIRRKPPETGILELWDSVVPGLALRIHAGGKRSYCVTARIKGRHVDGRPKEQVRRTIGTTVTHSLAQAREGAREILHDAAKGVDSASKEAKKVAAEQARREAERATAKTFRTVAEAWLADTGRGGGARLSRKKNILSQFEREVFPTLGAVPVTEIRRADVRDLVRALAIEKPIAANRCLATVRRALAWAVAQDKLDANPAAGIEAPAEEVSRDRVLSNAEIATLWPAFGQLGYPFGPVFQLLLLTGARRNEVGGMAWSEVDGDIWSLPGERTKNNRPHIVPLSTTAREILDNVAQIDGSDLIFTSNGKRPVSGWGRAKERLDKIAGVEGWTLHDLRRTLVTGMNEALNIEPHVVEAVVNHQSGGAKAGVAGVYNRALYLPQRKVALESWAQHIAGIVGGAAESNVVDFGKKR